jgi:hypothetical protein
VVEQRVWLYFRFALSYRNIDMLVQPPGSLGSFAFLSQVTPYGRESTAHHHHGQATELCCSEEADFAGRGTPAEPFAEQSSRELASANPHARKADEALSISSARSTFSLCIRVNQRSFSLAPTSPLRSPPSGGLLKQAFHLWNKTAIAALLP